MLLFCFCNNKNSCPGINNPIISYCPFLSVREPDRESVAGNMLDPVSSREKPLPVLYMLWILTQALHIYSLMPLQTASLSFLAMLNGAWFSIRSLSFNKQSETDTTAWLHRLITGQRADRDSFVCRGLRSKRWLILENLIMKLRNVLVYLRKTQLHFRHTLSKQALQTDRSFCAAMQPALISTPSFSAATRTTSSFTLHFPKLKLSLRVH